MTDPWVERKSMILSSNYSRVAFDSDEWEKRVQFASESLDLDQLPPGVFLEEVPFKNAIQIQFSRDLTDKRTEHTTVTIPFGVGQVYRKEIDARDVAMDIVRRNETAYTNVSVFSRTKFGGSGIFTDESNRLYY